MSLRDHAAEQRSYWRDVNRSHFAWLTSAPYIAATEAELLQDVDVAPGEKLLEIGCGEGTNLHHLHDRGARHFAIDFSSDKVAFARQVTHAAVACADAAALPFADGSFDAVLVRDVLHHVTDPARVLSEAYRVLRSGGRLTVIEPNGRSPLVLMQASLVREERGVLRSTGPWLCREVEQAGFAAVSLVRRQPFPLSRLLLHVRWGMPRLGSVKLIANLLGRLERSAVYLPQTLWTYLVVHGRRS